MVRGCWKDLIIQAMGKAVYKVCAEARRFSAVLKAEVSGVRCLLAVLRLLVVWRLVSSPMINPMPTVSSKVEGAVSS